MPEVIGLIECLNKRYPVGVRRFAAGRKYEAAIGKEIRLVRRLKKVFSITAIILFGFSCGCLYSHPWLLAYVTITWFLIGVYFLILGWLCSLHYISSERYIAERNQEYIQDAHNFFHEFFKDTRPNFRWLGRFAIKCKFIQSSLNYERKLVTQQAICGNLMVEDLVENVAREISEMKIDNSGSKQIAISVLHKIGKRRFSQAVFGQIISRSASGIDRMPIRRFSICVAKFECYADDSISMKPQERARYIWLKVQSRLGKCLTSEQQIEEAIFGNTHSSLDTILQHYDRLE